MKYTVIVLFVLSFVLGICMSSKYGFFVPKAQTASAKP